MESVVGGRGSSGFYVHPLILIDKKEETHTNTVC